MRLIRDGEKGGKGDMDVGEEGDYIPLATLSPPEWSCIQMGSNESHLMFITRL